ncbi:uncharacterized protein H6S33_006256 [Morchella sextelata]|uniref:uncharacterized protein n=1 Tax=Morchella sextelata TaxID=1174677 RepID=UPI001D057BA9|nr:uncharacterized protein H6S33_006256 [Morchella sextelata]KAH0604588.1 hypothetical protein H6S33_006256 [Morchella sextelata]
MQDRCEYLGFISTFGVLCGPHVLRIAFVVQELGLDVILKVKARSEQIAKIIYRSRSPPSSFTIQHPQHHQLHSFIHRSKETTKMRLSLLSACFGLVSSALAHCPSTSYNTTRWAPIPETARGMTIPATGYLTQHLGGGAYAILNGEYQSWFLVSDKGVIVMDCPPLIGRNCLYAIGNVTDIPVTHFVYSHAHADHAAGAVLWADAGVTFIAQELSKERIIEVLNQGNLPVPVPTVTFDKHMTLQVGNQTVELSYKGDNHAVGNIFIYAPKQKILALIDVVFPGWAPFGELGASEYIPGWTKAHDQILEYDFDYYIGGHVSRLGNRADVEIQRQYVMDLKRITIDAVAASTPLIAQITGPATAANPGNPWAQTSAYGQWLTDYCEPKINDLWVGKLGGADVYARMNCYKMIEAVRLDWGYLGPAGLRS